MQYVSLSSYVQRTAAHHSEADHRLAMLLRFLPKCYRRTQELKCYQHYKYYSVQVFTADRARSPESHSPSRKLLLIFMSQSRVFRPWRRASSRYCLPIDFLGVNKVPKASNVRRRMRRFTLRSREEGTKEHYYLPALSY